MAPQEIDTATLSDPVLMREDGSYLYTLPSVVDDIDLEITHVIRGEDHVVNTAVQIELFEALAAKPPQFAHHSLLIGGRWPGAVEAARLAVDRRHARAGDRADGGGEHAALIGTSESVHPVAAYEGLLKGFDLAHVSRAPARFDEEELKALNARLVHELPYEAVRERLTALGADGGPAFWQAVRGNLATLDDAQPWHDGGPRRDRPGHPRWRFPQRGAAAAAARAVGTGDLEGVDRPPEGGDGPGRQEPLSSAPARADRKRVGTGAGGAPAAHRAPPRRAPSGRAAGLIVAARA